MQKLITFNTLKVSNILSIGNDPVTIDFTRGLHFITGINKDKDNRQNGTGKSTIVDGLYFAITGEPIREITKDNISNNITGKTGSVLLDFKVTVGETITSYQIQRQVKPAKCILLENGNDVTRDSMANTTAEILKLLGCTKDSLQNFLSMTIGNTVPFFAKSKAERRQFIEGLLNLSVISKMQDCVKQDITLCTSEKNTLTAKIETLCSSKEQMVQIVAKQNEAKRQQALLIEQRKVRLTENLNNITKLHKQKLTELEEIGEVSTADKEVLDEKIAKLRDAKTKLERLEAVSKNEVKRISEHAAKLRKRDTSVPCSQCNRPYSEHDELQIAQERKDAESAWEIEQQKCNQYTAKLEEVNSAIQRTKASLDVIEQKLRRVQSLNMEIISAAKQIEEYNTQLQQLDKDTHTIEDDVKVNEANLQQFDADITLNRNALTENQVKSTLLSKARFALTEDGIRAFLINKIIGVVNSEISRYLSMLGSNAKCEFDSYFDPKIISETGKEVSYHNFSGAERKSLDLAIMFAFLSVMRMQGTSRYNLVMFDELIDSSFDSRGVEAVLNLIKSEVVEHDLAVYLITHRKETFGMGDSTIIVQKENGITRRIQ